MVKILSGDINPTEGAVLLDDICLRKWNKKALALRRSVLHSNSKLTFPFTVFEVVIMGRSPYHGTSKDNHASDKAITKLILAKTNIEHLINRSYTSLSGGKNNDAIFKSIKPNLAY